MAHRTRADSLACPRAGHLGHALANHVATKIASPIIRNIVDMLELIKLSPERVLANIAMTQKDDIMGQLRIVSVRGQ